MSIPTPKFVQGDQVATAFEYDPNLDRVEIVKVKYRDNQLAEFFDGNAYVTGWTYLLDDGTDSWADEQDLRKLPPDPSLSIESLMNIDNPIPEELDQ